MKKPILLSNNGLAMPAEFPRLEYEAVMANALKRAQQGEAYEQFLEAWNAVAFRVLAVRDYEKEFSVSLAKQDRSAAARYQQERQLFGFFSNGYSVIDACFYAAFSLGALLKKDAFPIATPKDRQRITPNSTQAAFLKSFPDDVFCSLLAEIATHQALIEWREVRNVLTHRSAPGRRMFVSFSSDHQLADEWKLNGIVLNKEMAPFRRKQLEEWLVQFIAGLNSFTAKRF